MNTLTIDEKSRIWVPRIVFNNTDDENESVVDAKTRVVVVRKVGRKAIFYAIFISTINEDYGLARYNKVNNLCLKFGHS